MSTTRIETVVVGGGQAGLSVSYYLTRRGREHVVLEQADAPANAWRNHRWDSFTLNTPNWQSQLPGAKHRAVNPDGFMTRAEIVAYFEDYVRRFHLPVRYRTHVNRVERDPLVVTITSRPAMAMRSSRAMSSWQQDCTRRQRSLR